MRDPARRHHLLHCPPAGSLHERFFQLFGERPDLVEIRKDSSGLSIEGYVAAREEIGPETAAAWAAEQRELGERDEFYVACVQVCFAAVAA